jgi:hypothetical protein
MKTLTALLLLCTLAISSFAQTNTAPKVFVDGDRDQLGNGVFLWCSVVDDGLPLPKTLTYTWSKVSGAGAVTISNGHLSMTHLRFAIKGLYVIQCSVSDGQYVSTDQITIMADTAADIAARP